VDIDGMINVKKKKYNFSKRKWKEIVSLNFVLRIEKMLSEESCCGIGVAMGCFKIFVNISFEKWQDCLNTNSGTSRLRRELPTCWIFQEGYPEKEIAIVQNLWCFNRRMFAKLLLVQNHGDFKVNLHQL
jgi:hypothetical protein